MFRSVITPEGNIDFASNYTSFWPSVWPSFSSYSTPVLDLSPMYSPRIVDLTDEEHRAIRQNELHWASSFLPAYNSPSRYTHSDVNNDRELRREVVKYFFDRFKHTWLPEYFSNLYKYFKVVDGMVKYVDSMEETDTNTSHNEVKARFIVSHIFEKIDMEALIEKYALKHRLNWYDLKKYNKEDIRDYVHNKIHKHIRNRINKL
jgi:hypothetical protein